MPGFLYFNTKASCSSMPPGGPYKLSNLLLQYIFIEWCHKCALGMGDELFKLLVPSHSARAVQVLTGRRNLHTIIVARTLAYHNNRRAPEYRAMYPLPILHLKA